MSQLSKGTLIGFIGVLFFSFTGILISILTVDYALPPLLLSLWRDFFVSLGLLGVVVVRQRRLPRIPRGQLGFFILYGLVLCVFNSAWTLSVPLNGAAVATVLAYGSVGISLVMARFFFREPITSLKVVAVIFSLSGCALVANAFNIQTWNTRPLGVTVGLGSAFLYALYTMAGKEAFHRRMDAWEATFFSFAFATLFFVIVNLFPEVPGTAGSLDRFMPDLPSSGWLLMAALALGPTLLGFTLYNLSMNYLPVSIASLIASLEPALTAVEAYILLDERMTALQLAGSVLVLAAIVLVRLGEGRGERAPRPGMPSASGISPPP
jgi:drug/metabolite transporter (DMT)-like permease